MPHLTTLVFFAVATLMLTASPGPGVIYVAARTLSQGRRAGFASMFGIERARWSGSRPPPQASRPLWQLRRAPLGRIFAQGFLIQILNPKVAVFAIAFLPQFLDPGMPVLPQVAVLGGVYIAIALAVDFSYVLGVGALSRRLLSSRIAQRRAGRVAAGTIWPWASSRRYPANASRGSTGDRSRYPAD